MPRAASPMRATPSTASALMDKIVDNDFDAHLAEVAAQERGPPGEPEPQARPRRRCRGRCGRSIVEEIRLRRAELTRDVPVPEPPFWGARTIERVPAKAVVPYLNERMLYQFQWGYRKDGRSLAEYKEWAKDELRPVLRAHARHRDPRGHPGAAGRLRLLAAAPPKATT